MVTGTPVELGRKVCVKRLSKGFGAFGLALGGAFLAMGCILVAGRETGLGAFGVAAGLFFLWAGLWTVTKRWEIHEEGIAAASLFGAQRFRFDEMATFSTGSVKQEHQTRVSLELIPRAGKPLRIVVREAEFDDDLKTLRDSLTTRVMAAMEETLRRSGYVEWLAAGSRGVGSWPSVGIEWSGLIVRGRPDLHLPWEAVNMVINNGFLILRQGPKGRVLVNCPVLAPNYRPGMALVDSILERGGAAAARQR
jgi:hypothetical protein